MREEILRVENVTRTIDGVIILEHISLHIFKGEIMGLLPLNAIGKKQFIELLVQNHPLTYGRVYLNHKLINSYEYSDRSMNKVSVIEQQRKLVEDLTVADNVFVLRKGFKQYIINKRILNTQMRFILEELGVDLNPEKKADNLAELERCIVELLRAVIAGCELIVVQDLSDFLSPSELEKFQKLIKYYQKKGTAFLYIGSHHEELFPFCERVALMDYGKIIRVFDKKNLKEENIQPYIISFEMAKAGTGKKNMLPILEFEDVCAGRLNHMDLSINEGECAVILDMSNSAIKDILRLVNGEINLEQGEVHWKRKPWTKQQAKYPIRNGIGIIYNDPIQLNLFEDLSYIENLSFLIDQKHVKGNMKKIEKSIIQEYEALAGPDIYAKNLYHLSQKALYTLAYLKMHLYHPELVFCIQPFSWADMYLRRHILDLIQLLKDQGITVVILLVSLSDSLDIADRLFLIEQGKKLGEYPQEEFFLFRDQL